LQQALQNQNLPDDVRAAYQKRLESLAPKHGSVIPQQYDVSTPERALLSLEKAGVFGTEGDVQKIAAYIVQRYPEVLVEEENIDVLEDDDGPFWGTVKESFWGPVMAAGGAAAAGLGQLAGAIAGPEGGNMPEPTEMTKKKQEALRQKDPGSMSTKELMTWGNTKTRDAAPAGPSSFSAHDVGIGALKGLGAGMGIAYAPVASGMLAAGLPAAGAIVAGRKGAEAGLSVVPTAVGAAGGIGALRSAAGAPMAGAGLSGGGASASEGGLIGQAMRAKAAVPTVRDAAGASLLPQVGAPGAANMMGTAGQWGSAARGAGNFIQKGMQMGRSIAQKGMQMMRSNPTAAATAGSVGTMGAANYGIANAKPPGAP
jgi:hypothetical protein